MLPATGLHFVTVPSESMRGILERMENLSSDPDPKSAAVMDSNGAVRLPKPFPLVRYYLLASVLLVIGAFAILNFSTQRIQSGTAINSLRQEAEADVERLVFDLSLAITSYVHPGDDLTTALHVQKSELDRDVINALSGMPIARVDLLTPDGVLAYSTDPEASVAISVGESRNVVAGNTFSRYEDDYKLKLFNGEPAEIATIITANPVNTEWSVDDTGPVAVLVAFSDVTEAVPSVTGAVAPERLAVLGGTMAALFVLLSWIVIRGHKFTTDARERLSAMLESERDIRNQLDIRNSELVEANKAKSQFLALISHELKTPLTAINSFANSLEKSIGSSLNERQSRQFDALSRNGMRLKLLIDELLDVSAASSGKLSLNFEDVTVGEVVTEAIQIARPQVDVRDQRLVVLMKEPDLEFSGDPARLQQVMANLISNASKYSPVGSEIHVDALEYEGHACIQVRDTGIGISAEDQQRLFSTFFRSEEAVASGEPGTGLGMVVVKSIVEGHGGFVKVESDLGSGTTVRVDIPLGGVAQGVSADDSDRAA